MVQIYKSGIPVVSFYVFAPILTPSCDFFDFTLLLLFIFVIVA